MLLSPPQGEPMPELSRIATSSDDHDIVASPLQSGVTSETSNPSPNRESAGGLLADLAAPASPGGSSEAVPPPDEMRAVSWSEPLAPAPFSKLRLTEHAWLGYGSSAVVYRADTDNPSVGSIAVKVYRGFVTKTNEIRGLKCLHDKVGPHKGIATIFGLADVPMSDGSMWPALLMKEMRTDGERLFRVLHEMRDQGDISQPEFDGAVQLFARRTMKALRHINGAKMTVADIKPSNLLFSDDEKARSVISDFDQWSDDVNRRSGGEFKYMPPDMRDDSELGQIGFEPKYDVYSLGVTLAELVGEADTDHKRADFIGRLTHSDPQQRPTPDQALKHPYLEKQTGESKQRSIGVLLRAVATARGEETDT